MRHDPQDTTTEADAPRRAPRDGEASGSAAPRGQGRRRRLGALALVALGFLAGSVTSGAGAVWASHQFPDVPFDNQFHDDIDWLVDNGIANGYDDGTFRPTAPVSRQAMAAFLHRQSDTIRTVGSGLIDPLAGTSFQATATCPAGTRVIGGNALTFDTTIVLQSASPTIGRSYVAVWHSRTGAVVDPASIYAEAICVPA